MSAGPVGLAGPSDREFVSFGRYGAGPSRQALAVPRGTVRNPRFTNPPLAFARLGCEPAYWGRVRGDAVGGRIVAEMVQEGVDVTGVRRIAGCVSSSDAILIDDACERLVCVYNDPRLEQDAGWLPLDAVRHCQAVLADVRWRDGARALLRAAARHGIPAVFRRRHRPPENLDELSALASHVVYSEPGLARATGVSSFGIVARHLVPNTLGPVIVYATLTIPSVMLLEAFLSFLGIGVQAPLASWGSLAADGIQNIAIFPWQLICPGVTMAVTLFSMNFLGDGLRDALDPQMRKG